MNINHQKELFYCQKMDESRGGGLVLWWHASGDVSVIFVFYCVHHHVRSLLLLLFFFFSTTCCEFDCRNRRSRGVSLIISHCGAFWWRAPCTLCFTPSSPYPRLRSTRQLFIEWTTGSILLRWIDQSKLARLCGRWDSLRGTPDRMFCNPFGFILYLKGR